MTVNREVDDRGLKFRRFVSRPATEGQRPISTSYLDLQLGGLKLERAQLIPRIGQSNAASRGAT
jgi:hypothetical protein